MFIKKSMINESPKTALIIPEKRLNRKFPLIFFQNKSIVNVLKCLMLMAFIE